MERVVPRLKLSHYLGKDKLLRDNFIKDLYNSFLEYGFVVIADHNIPFDLMNDTFKVQAELFKLPVDIKNKYCLNNGGQRGYTPFGQENAKGASVKDLKEFWHVGREFDNNDPDKKLYHQNVWVDELPNFKESILKLTGFLDNIGNNILEALTYSFDVDKEFFSQRVRNGNSVLRLLHYPPIADGIDPRQIRAASHTDINLITLLIASKQSGLQLLDKNGCWLDVKSDPNDLVVNMGDQLSRITNDVLKSTIHRVINPVGENISRYSAPYFIHPRKEVVLSALPKYEGLGEKYPDINSHDFLMERLKEIGLKK